MSEHCVAVTKPTSEGPRGYLGNVRRAIPWVAAAIVLVALWPTVCMSQEGGPATCQSAVLLPLPWGTTADTWGWVSAIGAALLTFLALRTPLRHGASDAD